METKVCTKCGEEKPATREYFSPVGPQRPGLLRGECKECRREVATQRYQKNKIRLAAEKREWRKKHPERHRAIDKRSREKNREKIKERRKKYGEQNPEKISLANKRSYEKNRESRIAYQTGLYNKSPAGIYKLTNKKNGMIYIGQSVSTSARWNQHKSRLRLGNHGNPKIQEDYDKYGLDAFEFKVLEEHPCDADSETLKMIERETINRFLAEGKKLYNRTVKDKQWEA
tara:strand:- start:25 stop:711 length:687 start_codon:yes stop_codon:yes gene_type:complete